MRHEVLLTENAFYDLEEIYDYIAKHDHPANADYVINSMESVIENLATLPEKGAFPKELLELGIREYRQVFFKPYRAIYRVIGSCVYILLIADGRRDMGSLLSRRLLG